MRTKLVVYRSGTDVDRTAINRKNPVGAHPD